MYCNYSFLTAFLHNSVKMFRIGKKQAFLMVFFGIFSEVGTMDIISIVPEFFQKIFFPAPTAMIYTMNEKYIFHVQPLSAIYSF